VLGFAQTQQGLCPCTPPPFEKGGPELYFLMENLTLNIIVETARPDHINIM
jgi:hypothetical protein